MADFELEDKHGNRYRIRQGAGPRFWHPENLGAGSSLLADNLLSAMPANGLQQAHNHFYFNVLIKIPNLPCRPQDALCSALSNSYLTIEKIGTALAINDDEPDPRNELRVKIRNALMAIVAGERAEADMYQKQMDKETTVMKGVIYTGAFMQGVGSSAWGMVVWLKEVSDVVNPFVKMQHHARALQAAWESEDFTKTYSETYVKGEKRELVEALGFDPTQITEQQIDEAMAMANLVIEDPSLRDMLYQFVKDYAEAQHAIEITNVAGTAAFELILTIIMAAVTGGVGAVAAIGSKAHLIKKFQKVGDLLSDFAKATRKLKLEGKKRKAKGNSAKFSDMEADQVQAKKTDAHGAETGEVSKQKPEASIERKYVPMPSDLVPNSAGVYGYVPTPESQFHSSKWPVDWTNPNQVANARTTRLDYHVGLEKKKQLIENLRKEGMSTDDIAKKIVNSRNQDRLSHYKSPEALDVVYKRNLEKYGDKMGPTYESQLSKYGSSDEVINAALRTNDSMDILTGISTPKGRL
jgi:hypothetical protein